jgi:hypothetical protein
MANPDQFIEEKLERLVSGLLRQRLGEPLTRALLDAVEETVYTKCGIAVGLMIVNSGEYVAWQGLAGQYYHVWWGL